MPENPYNIDPKTGLKIYTPPSNNLTQDELNYLGHKWRGNYSAKYLPPGGLYSVDGGSMQQLSPNQINQVSDYMKNTSFGKDLWQSMPNIISDHRGKDNRLMEIGGNIYNNENSNNMYQMKNPYMAEGGQPQINKEQAMVQQLIQAFSQLSPQGQQMFVQGLQQVMEQSQGQQQGQQQGQETSPQDQGQDQQMQQQPQQKMGGYNNPGFRSLPQSVQDKIMRNS